jgi:hypothetical protein
MPSSARAPVLVIARYMALHVGLRSTWRLQSVADAPR